MIGKEKNKIPERVIAKGKKKEVLSDKLIEIGERIFDWLIEKWKQVVLGVFIILVVGFGIWIFSEQRKNKMSEELAEFERALLLITAYDITKDTERLKEAEEILSRIQKNPKFIPEIYRAWVKSKMGEEGKKSAVDILNSVITSDAPEEVKKIARIMKIHISENCDEILQTWKEIKGEEKKGEEVIEEIISEREKGKADFLFIPLRTYFEVAKCGDKNPDALNSIISELESLYSIEQFISPDNAKKILMVKKFAESKLREIQKRN